MLAFIGGTGPEGLGLAMRFAAAGDEIVIGSRALERAQEAAAKVKEVVREAKVSGAENADAVRQGDLIILSIPYSGQRQTLEALRDIIGDKVVLNVIAPLQFEKGRISAIRVEEGSAAQQAQLLLPDAKVVSAFQNLSAEELQEIEHPMPCDVIVCGDHKEPKEQVMRLAEKIKGVRALDGGKLENSRYVEDFTALLLILNRRYKTQTAIKIEGIK
ncbi:MAG: NADPH-dependent F420 reductase [Chloroflexi bacterium]|nr:NADPH-dependent F420 reductase [Chloroflexota bacterium]